ncbi:MAG TPA: extracellular solute-binding protein, partial [Fimbriimonas sp.]
MLRFSRTLLSLLFLLLASLAFAEQPIQLRYVVWDGDEAMVAIRKAVRQFEERYPHIKVKLETVTANYQEKLLAQVAAKVAPDVAMMDPPNFQKFAKRGAILPLNPFFNDIPGFSIDAYYPEIVKPHSYRGQVYVLPRDIAPISVVYYNKELFQKAGIAYPRNTLTPDGKWDPKANWTWDYRVRPELKERDFIWVMQQLTRKDPNTGKVVQWGYLPAWVGLMNDMFAYSQGMTFADDDEEPTKVLIGDPKMIKAQQWVADLALKHKFMPSPTELSSVLQTNARQLFTQGKVAMFQSGIWEVPGLRKDLWDPQRQRMSFDWDIAMAPAYKDGTLVTPTGGSGYSILSQTKHPKEAWLLTAWMAGAPGMIAMAEAGLAQPALSDLAQKEPWIPGPGVKGEMAYPKNRIITHLSVPHVKFGPTAMFWSDVHNVIWQTGGRIFDGTSTAQAELTAGQLRGQKRLDTLRAEQAQLEPFNWWLGGAIGLVLIGILGAWVYLPERGRKLGPKARRENRIAYLFVLPWLLGLILFTAGPMILSFLMSFTEWDIIQSAKFRGLDNYREAGVVDIRFWKSISVTLIYTIFSVPLGLVTALALALLLNVKVKGIPLYRTLYYLPSLASAVAASLIWRAVFRAEGGLLNLMLYSEPATRLGIPNLLKPLAGNQDFVNWLGDEQTALSALIIMSAWGAGGGMIILLAALQGVPQFFYEAATVDGASPWQRFKAITLPMISPAIFFSLLTGFIGSFQSFSQAFLMTGGGPNDSTMFYILNLYNQAFLNLRMGYAS